MKTQNLLLIGAIGVGVWYFFLRKKNDCIDCDTDELVEEFKTKMFEYQKTDWKEKGEDLMIKSEQELIELEDKLKGLGLDLVKIYESAGLPLPMNLKALKDDNETINLEEKQNELINQ